MIPIKDNKEIEKIKESGKKLFLVMQEIKKNIKPGINTKSLDKIAEETILKLGGIPAFKNYGTDFGKPYPASICASVNDEIVHSIPSLNKILKEGAILKIDVGIKYQGMFTDMARTFAVGETSNIAKKLIKVTEESFWKGLKNMKNGSLLSNYSKAVQEVAENNGFSVVRDLVGHGIGVELHEDPQILNYFTGFYKDLKLQTGMVLALEPMINEGNYHTIVGEDGWVFKTKDGKLSAHYENTVLITESGVEVLTS